MARAAATATVPQSSASTNAALTAPPVAALEARTMRLVATCALGLEPFLADELRALGYETPTTPLEMATGAVMFQGGWADVWRTNLWLRTANRVLVGLASWSARDDEELTAGARSLVSTRDASWGGISAAELFSPDFTLAIRATSRESALSDVRWIGVRAKDGLVDGQRDRFGRRSWVAREDPDLPLRIFLDRDHATLLLDTSGHSLDHRGYRGEASAAPVREALAAACALAGLAGLRERQPIYLLDPMCGSGTLLVEAGWAWLGWAPGRLRARWSFERLPGFVPTLFAKLAGQARAGERRPSRDLVRLVGRDLDPATVGMAKACVAKAGLTAITDLATGDAFLQTPPPGPGLLLVNPPYGERLAASPDLPKRLGELLATRYRGWRAVVLLGGEARQADLGVPIARRVEVRNGPLEASILVLQP